MALHLFFLSIPKKDNDKECSNYCIIALISYASKVELKILQARLQQYVNREIPDVQVGFRKARRTRDQIANIWKFSVHILLKPSLENFEHYFASV